MEEKYITFLRDTRKRLDAVSPSFCLAKWLQVTVHLGTGKTHSCHHPRAHTVGVGEVEADPSALHNSLHKMHVERKDMMQGIQTPDCDYCWRIENTQPDAISDRMLKSASPWAISHLQRVADNGALTPITPTYLEVNMGTTCNMRCLYCSPEFSSRWEEDAMRHGGYELANGSKLYDPIWLQQNNMLQIKTERDEQNPYEKAFDKWLPTIINDLHTLRLTGGEPLLNKSSWKVMDELIANPNPGLEFAINTNLCVPDKLIDQLIANCNALRGKVKTLTIFTSAEATGEQQEFIRDGMNWRQFQHNVERLLSETKVRVTFMTTINVLSQQTFVDFVRYVLGLRKLYDRWTEGMYSRVGLSINYLRFPDFLRLTTLSSPYRLKFNADVHQLADEEQPEIGGLYPHEREQLKQLGQWTLDGTDADSVRQAADLMVYLRQVWERRGLDHNRTFPGLRDRVGA